MSKHVTIEKQGRIAVVRFDRGDGKNALSRDLMRELMLAARSFEDDIETSAVILTGSADVFSMGFDLNDRSLAEAANAGLAARRLALQSGPRMAALS